MRMLKNCALLVALLQLMLVITTAPVDAGTTTLIPFGRIKFGKNCEWFLHYFSNNNTCFVGPSPINQHWYLASDSSRPNVYAIVTHPVPNKALYISCYSHGCYVKVAPIPQLYPGWPFPSLGNHFFFYKIKNSSDCISFLSYENPSYALTVAHDGNVIVRRYNRSRYDPDQCFCPLEGPPPSPTPVKTFCPTFTCGLTKQEVVGRIEAYPTCHDFIGYDAYYTGYQLQIQGPYSVQQHWSFFSGSTSSYSCNPNEFMIATYPVPDKVLKVECFGLVKLRGFKRVASSSSSCSLKIVKAPCPLEYNTPFCHPGDEYLFTKEKPAADYYVLRSVLQPSLAITVSGTRITLGNYGLYSYNQRFCCPPPPPTTVPTPTATADPTLIKYTRAQGY